MRERESEEEEEDRERQTGEGNRDKIYESKLILLGLSLSNWTLLSLPISHF